MRRLAPFALAALLAMGCGTSDCQKLGERLCSCTGLGQDACKKQVEDQLKNATPTETKCEELLASCNEPSGYSFCEWLGTEAGKVACGIAQPPGP